MEANEVAAIREVFFAELADAVEAEHRWDNRMTQTTDRLFYQHFRTGDLHDVQHEANANRPRLRFVGP